MKLTDKNSEIRIYQSVWKNTFYAICCLAFAIVGYLIIINPSTKWPTKIFGGLLNMIFFGGASALFFAMASHKRIRRIPFLIIYADRLGIYKQRNGDYHTINYADVKKFRLVKIHSSKMIAVDYKTAPLIHKFDPKTPYRNSDSTKPVLAIRKLSRKLPDSIVVPILYAM